MSKIVGIEKLYAAKQLEDTQDSLVYDTPMYLPGVQALELSPKSNITLQYAEDKLWDQDTTFDSADVGIDRTDLSSAERAFLLGQLIAENGGIIATDKDKAPFVAVMYKAPLAETGEYRYGVIYKGRFQPPQETMKGKEGKTEYQSPKLTGTFQPIKHEIDFGEAGTKSPWEYHVDTTDPNCPADIDETWFESVPVPSVDAVAPTFTSSPANNATSVATSAPVVITFNKAMDPASLVASNLFLMTAAGALIAGTISLNAAFAVATFTPTSALSTGVHLFVVTSDCRSASGVRVAANSTVKFTVGS